MKLTYLHQYFNTPNMTGGSRTYEMAKRLAARGHEVHVVTSSREGEAHKGWKVEIVAGIHVHWISVPYHNNMSYIKRIMAFLKFANLATIRSVKLRSDVIFATSTPLTIAIPAIATMKLTKSPMVFEVRDLWPELPIAIGALRSPLTIWIARILEKTAYKNAKYCIGCSPGMCAGIVKQGKADSHVYEISNSCDIEQFNVAPELGEAFRKNNTWLVDRPLIVYAGTFGKINGLEYMVRLAHAMSKISPEIVFLAVGHGQDASKINQLSIELGVKDKNFYMLPKQPKNKIPEIYSAATVVLSLFLPIKEMEANSANKFFDGMAAGKPIAINYGGWQAELLQNHDNGVVLDSTSIELAAKQLSDILVPDRLESMGSNSLEIARSQYSRDDMADRLENILLKACDRSDLSYIK